MNRSFIVSLLISVCFVAAAFAAGNDAMRAPLPPPAAPATLVTPPVDPQKEDGILEYCSSNGKQISCLVGEKKGRDTVFTPTSARLQVRHKRSAVFKQDNFAFILHVDAAPNGLMQRLEFASHDFLTSSDRLIYDSRDNGKSCVLFGSVIYFSNHRKPTFSESFGPSRPDVAFRCMRLRSTEAWSELRFFEKKGKIACINNLDYWNQHPEELKYVSCFVPKNLFSKDAMKEFKPKLQEMPRNEMEMARLRAELERVRRQGTVVNEKLEKLEKMTQNPGGESGKTSIQSQRQQTSEKQARKIGWLPKQSQPVNH